MYIGVGFVTFLQQTRLWRALGNPHASETTNVHPAVRRGRQKWLLFHTCRFISICTALNPKLKHSMNAHTHPHPQSLLVHPVYVQECIAARVWEQGLARSWSLLVWQFRFKRRNRIRIKDMWFILQFGTPYFVVYLAFKCSLAATGVHSTGSQQRGTFCHRGVAWLWRSHWEICRGPALGKKPGKNRDFTNQKPRYKGFDRKEYGENGVKKEDPTRS